jgi:putative ABC transport system permease protein
VIGRDWERAYPDTSRNRTLTVRTELQSRVARVPPSAMLVAMLTTLAVSVLFVACANVAGLLTSRAPVRAREMAIRSAIGAGRGGLIRQLMTENLLLAAAGGALGIGLGFGAARVFQQIRFSASDLPIALNFALDRRALDVSVTAAVVCALLFGVAPAIQTSRVDLTTLIKGTDAAAGPRRRRGRSVLVAGQVAASVVLLVIAVGTYQTFREELGSGPGYRLDHLLMMSFEPNLIRYTQNDTGQFFDRLVEGTRSLPGVKSAALASHVPMQTMRLSVTSIAPEGYTFPAGTDRVNLFSAFVDEQYFATLRIPLVRGRPFRVQDSATSPRVAIVNELAARHYWPGQDPIGQRFRIDQGGASTWVEIVGVAKNSKYLLLAEPPTEYLYLPYRQHPHAQIILLAESAGDPASLVAPIRRLVQSLDANQPIYDVRTMEEFYQMTTVSLFNGIIRTIAAMGLMGLGLSIVGLYGLVAYAATRRTREIGIRMALGADRPAVLRMVLRQGVALAIAGLVVGVIASVGAGRVLKAAFPGPGAAFDPIPILVVVPIVLAVTSAAAYIPARRASRLDPVTALRYE